jgi:hypothetical protein
MKFNRQLLFLIAILVIIALLIVFSNTSIFRPYNGYSVFSQYYPYEGLTNLADTAQEFKSSMLPNVTTKPSNREGFLNLQSSPVDSEKPLDIFSQIPGSLQCDKIASNLHNSKGGLCLTKEAHNLLSTRGGNLTGKDFQYGSP